MKKILLMGAAAAAMILASCVKETSLTNDPDENGNNNPIELQGSAYASFSFNLNANNTRAIAQYDPQGVAENDAADKLIGYGDLYLLIFKDDPTGVLEYTAKISAADATATGHNHTALLTAGAKKIFVLANLGTDATNNVMPNLVKTDGGTATTGTSVTWADLDKNGTPTITSLTDFYKIAFNAGIPQTHSVDKAVERSFSIVPFSTRVSTTLGLPMSNSNRYSFTLTANVTKEQADDETAGTATQGTHANNRFKITLDYLGAKARLALAASFPQNTASHTGGPVAEITGGSYTIKNLAKFTNLVQKVAVNGANADPQSYYHNFPWPANPVQTDYDPHFDQASNLYTGPGAVNFQNGLPLTTTKAEFIFVPENTNPLLNRGQSSFYAMHVTYKPQQIVKVVDHNPLANAGQGAIAFSTYDNWDALKALAAGTPGRLEGTDGNQYFYYIAGISGGVLNATTGNAGAAPLTQFFANKRVFADALWIKANNKKMTDPSTPGSPAVYSTTAADELFDALVKDEDYLVFTDANSFYRLDIGEGTGEAASFGVLRGKAYTATVTDIVGPGVPTEADLFLRPEEPVVAKAYGNVTIEAAIWNPTEQYSPIQ